VPLVLLLAFLGVHFALALTHDPAAHSTPAPAADTAQCGSEFPGTRDVDRNLVFLPGVADHEHDDESPQHSHPDYNGMVSGRSSADELANPALWSVHDVRDRGLDRCPVGRPDTLSSETVLAPMAPRRN
jgi:hypothetical protein